jgi:hypothetical protein
MRGLTIKQREWVRHTVATRNPTEAAFRVYEVKDRHNASVIATENLRKPYLREHLYGMLEQSGLKLQDTIMEHAKTVRQNKNRVAKIHAIRLHYELIGLVKKYGNYGQ